MVQYGEQYQGHSDVHSVANDYEDLLLVELKNLSPDPDYSNN